MLRISGTTRLLSVLVLGCITVPKYPQLFSPAQSTQSIWPLFCAGSGKPLGNDGGNGVEQPGLDADGILLQTQRTSFERSSSPVRRGQDCWCNPKQARLLGSSSNPNKEKEWKGSPGEYINTCMIVHKHTMYRKVMWLCVAGHSYSSTKWKQNL